MRLPTPRQLFICIALMAVFGCAHASEARHPTAPDGVTTAAETGPANIDRLDETDIDGAVAATHAVQRTQKSKAPATASARTTSDNRMMPPRYHSFLPGMFR